MIHYTCDMCGKSIEPGRDVRYQLHVEIEAVPEGTECEEWDFTKAEETESLDLSEEMADYLDMMGADEPTEEDDPDFRAFHFDLCASCQSQYRMDPLMKHHFRPKRFGISDN